MLISTTSRPVIRAAKLVGTCVPASVPPILTPASNQRGSLQPATQRELCRRSAAQVSQETLTPGSTTPTRIKPVRVGGPVMPGATFVSPSGLAHLPVPDTFGLFV